MQTEVDQMRDRIRELRLEMESVSRKREQEIGVLKQNEEDLKY